MIWKFRNDLNFSIVRYVNSILIMRQKVLNA